MRSLSDTHGRGGLFVLCLIFSLILTTAGCRTESAQNADKNETSPVPNSARNSNGEESTDPLNRACSEYPTIAQIDCSRFPKDPGEGQTDSGTKYYVSKTGKDSYEGTSPSRAFKTISYALSRIKAGSEIVVGQGEYTEGAPDEYRALVFEKNDVRLRASGEGRVLVRPASADIKYGINIRANNITIDGIDLEGFTSALVTLESGIKNIVLKNLNLKAGESDSVDGIVSPDDGGMDGLLIRNVNMEGANLGISCNVGPCRDWWIDNTKIVGRGAGDDSGADAIASEVRNEDAPDNEISSNWLITNVEATGASGDGIDMKAVRVAVFNANVHDNERNGVKFWRGGDLVNSFVVNHGADAAIVFDRAGTYRILNTLIAYENFGRGPSYTMTVGYDLPNDDIKLYIVNSVFYRNSGSIWLSPNTTATIRNCLLGETDTNEIAVKGDTQVTENDDPGKLSNVSTAEANLPFKTDPMFKDPPSDFSFAAGSPLVNAALTPRIYPAFDFRGEPRLKGDAPDIGPLELY